MRDWVRSRMPVQSPDQCNQSQRPLDSRRMWQLAREIKSSSNPALEASQEQHRQLVRQRQKERAASQVSGGRGRGHCRGRIARGLFHSKAAQAGGSLSSELSLRIERASL